MPSDRFVDSLNQQVGREFSAAQQYIAVAVFYEAETLPRLAAFFFRQALEERDHAMMMLRYLLDADVAAVVPGVDAPRSDFGDVVEPVRIALDQERRVSDQIGALAAMAREDGDYLSEQFLQWFLKERRVRGVSSQSRAGPRWWVPGCTPPSACPAAAGRSPGSGLPPCCRRRRPGRCCPPSSGKPRTPIEDDVWTRGFQVAT
jgi:ferritin